MEKKSVPLSMSKKTPIANANVPFNHPTAKVKFISIPAPNVNACAKMLLPRLNVLSVVKNGMNKAVHVLVLVCSHGPAPLGIVMIMNDVHASDHLSLAKLVTVF